MATVELIALTAHAYAGRRLAPGQRYAASRQDARLLTGLKRARYVTADMDVEPAKKKTTRGRGAYRRQDVQAAKADVPVDMPADEPTDT